MENLTYNSYLLMSWKNILKNLLHNRENEMSGTILYIIDMQPGFTASNKIIKEVGREIKLARRRKDHIIFVELRAGLQGKTHGELIRAAYKNGYDKVSLITKKYADGSKEFIDEITNFNLFCNRVRVCGVNRGVCVLNTVEGLVHFSKIGKMGKAEIEISKSATAGDALVYERNEWIQNHITEQFYHRMAKRNEIYFVP